MPLSEDLAQLKLAKRTSKNMKQQSVLVRAVFIELNNGWQYTHTALLALFRRDKEKIGR